MSLIPPPLLLFSFLVRIAFCFYFLPFYILFTASDHRCYTDRRGDLLLRSKYITSETEKEKYAFESKLNNGGNICLPLKLFAEGKLNRRFNTFMVSMRVNIPFRSLGITDVIPTFYFIYVRRILVFIVSGTCMENLKSLLPDYLR